MFFIWWPAGRRATRRWRRWGCTCFCGGALASALYCFGIIRFLPANDNLTHLDVYWYADIVRRGYTYSATAMSSAAFFPLFPYLWRFTGLNLLGISLLNAGMFLVAFAWLAHSLRLPPRWALLLLSTPYLLFMVVPYTEALFFAFGTLLLVGLHRQRLAWWVLGLLGCGLTRAASTLFTPALLLMVLLWAAQPGQARRALRWGGAGLGALAASVGVVAAVQGYQTGEPWGFILAQKHWNHRWQWPHLPFMTPSGIHLLWLDGLALWLGLVALGACAWLGWRWLRRGRRPLPAVPPAVVFSLGYCVSVTLFVLSHQGGSIWNIGRYLLATPFLVVLVAGLGRLPAWPGRFYAYAAAAALGVWQLLGAFTLEFDSFTRGQSCWYFGLTTLYLLAYLALRQLRWQREVIVLLYVFNLVVQLHLLEGFLQGYTVQ